MLSEQRPAAGPGPRARKDLPRSETDPQAYLRAFTEIYISLPEAPRRLNHYYDRQVALHWFQEQISLRWWRTAAPPWPRCAALPSSSEAALGHSAPLPIPTGHRRSPPKSAPLLPTSPICGSKLPPHSSSTSSSQNGKGGQLRGPAVSNSFIFR